MYRIRTIGRLGMVTALVFGLLSLGPQARAARSHARILYAHTFPSGNVDIVSVLPDGTDLQRLTTRASFDACPTAAPNGARLSLCSDHSGAFEIWSMDRGGGRLHKSTRFGAWAADPDFRTGPGRNKRLLAFTADVGNGHDIYVGNWRGKNLRRLTESPAADDFPAWSPDGSLIAFVSDRTGTPQVYVMNKRGGHVTRLTNDPSGVTEGPDWRPDGSGIVFAAGPVGAEDIFLMNPDGSNVRQLTTDPASDFAPAWSPNGQRIAFLSTRVAGGRNVFVMDANGTNQHPVTSPGSIDFGPAWLPRRHHV